MSDEKRISRRASSRLTRSGELLYVSVVSVWEIVTKHQAGKLWAGRSIRSTVDSIEAHPDWTMLNLTASHLKSLADLAYFEDHKDPFDRLLIAQASTEGLAVITSDSQFFRYGIPVIW